MRNRLVASIALVLGLTILARQHDAVAASINFSPLFSYESSDERYDFTLAGPLLEFTSDFTAVRPLFYRDDTQTDILYPLGHSAEKDTYFVPFLRHSDEKDRMNTDVLLFSYGREDDETYGGFFPLYGTYSHRFGHDRLRYVLWPLYTKMTDDGHETYSVLWPVLKYSQGREFQVFPLYGYKKTETSRHDYFLWPFIHHKTGEERFDAFLPFFAYTRGDAHKGISVIWPLFTYNRNLSPELTSITFPWPLVRFASGAYEEREIFPFYWSKDYGESYRMRTVLWPFYRHVSSYDEKEDIREESTSILVLSSKMKKVKGQTVESESLTIWPLWHRHSFPESTSWYFPWIFPFHDEGFRRNYLPLFTLARADKAGNSSQLDVLWHTISYRKQDSSSRFSLSFLFSYEQGPGYGQIGFLSDLLHWKWACPDEH